MVAGLPRLVELARFHVLGQRQPGEEPACRRHGHLHLLGDGLPRSWHPPSSSCQWRGPGRAGPNPQCQVRQATDLVPLARTLIRTHCPVVSASTSVLGSGLDALAFGLGAGAEADGCLRLRVLCRGCGLRERASWSSRPAASSRWWCSWLPPRHFADPTVGASLRPKDAEPRGECSEAFFVGRGRRSRLWPAETFNLRKIGGPLPFAFAPSPTLNPASGRCGCLPVPCVLRPNAGREPAGTEVPWPQRRQWSRAREQNARSPLRRDRARSWGGLRTRTLGCALSTRGTWSAVV